MVAGVVYVGGEEGSDIGKAQITEFSRNTILLKSLEMRKNS